ncbi:hypothetical protein KR054_005894 [Drosophila jambulina]|nr:hypothetical protein KR054_005894 [Drosophila jambulina]
MEDRSCTVANRADLLPQREFPCQWCFGKVYKSRARYHGHLKRIHHITNEPDNGFFNCYHCPCSDCRYHKHAPGLVAFREIAQLRRHYQRHHMEKNVICAVCQREFKLERELFLHVCRWPNTVTAEYEDRASLEHVQHQVDPKTHTGSKNSLLSALHLFRNKPETVDKHHSNQESDKENKPWPNGRQMQKCAQCKKKYIARHRCSEHPCPKCGRVFFCKSALELHFRKSAHSLRVEDKIFVDEVLQLLISIEDGTLRDPPLLNAFAEILPVLEKIQEH